MSNLLTFITTFGTAAEMRALSSQELTAKMREFGLTKEEMKLIVTGDQQRAIDFIYGSEKITCLVVAPENPDEEGDEDSDDNENTDGQNQAISIAI